MSHSVKLLNLISIVTVSILAFQRKQTTCDTFLTQLHTTLFMTLLYLTDNNLLNERMNVPTTSSLPRDARIDH